MNEPSPAGDATRDFIIRPATMDDIPALVRRRCEMFHDMGQLRDDAYDALAEAATRYFAEAIPSGEYMAWVVTPRDQPDLIIAGGGVQLRRILPRPSRDGKFERPGPQGLVVNVYTEPQWRHKGIAEFVMLAITEWSRQNGVTSLVLH